jgi:hypothetical protein
MAPTNTAALPDDESELCALRDWHLKQLEAIEAALDEIEAASSFAERRELWRDYHQSVL